MNLSTAMARIAHLELALRDVSDCLVDDCDCAPEPPNHENPLDHQQYCSHYLRHLIDGYLAADVPGTCASTIPAGQMVLDSPTGTTIPAGQMTLDGEATLCIGSGDAYDFSMMSGEYAREIAKAVADKMTLEQRADVLALDAVAVLSVSGHTDLMITPESIPDYDPVPARSGRMCSCIECIGEQPEPDHSPDAEKMVINPSQIKEILHILTETEAMLRVDADPLRAIVQAPKHRRAWNAVYASAVRLQGAIHLLKQMDTCPSNEPKAPTVIRDRRPTQAEAKQMFERYDAWWLISRPGRSPAIFDTLLSRGDFCVLLGGGTTCDGSHAPGEVWRPIGPDGEQLTLKVSDE